MTHYAVEYTRITVKGENVARGPMFRIACGLADGEAVTEGPGVNLRREVDCPNCRQILLTEGKIRA